MILKSFEVKKKIKDYDYYLFYGENDALKKELINLEFKPLFKNKFFSYDETEILKNEIIFFEEILSQSLFDKEKLIIISRTSDKILNVVSEIQKRKIENLKIIFIANNLEKKSKLRNFFEKEKKLICVPFYQDNFQTLTIFISNFFKEKKITISREITNLILQKANYDRNNLINELQKIESFAQTKKLLTKSDILKIINLAEKNNFSEIIDLCLMKNQKKFIEKINENYFLNDDAIILSRTLLQKAKRLEKLKYEQNHIKNNINQVIDSFKPPIFWKDKEIVKQQMANWTLKSIREVIYSISVNELKIKKNSINAINILLDFMFSLMFKKIN